MRMSWQETERTHRDAEKELMWRWRQRQVVHVQASQRMLKVIGNHRKRERQGRLFPQSLQKEPTPMTPDSGFLDSGTAREISVVFSHPVCGPC